ncbi:MAG: NAD-dependent malic enzyme [Desulfurivibrionaceae bacterium]|nr:NAD-dependent malic enzyme [Desulfobulbales bacterium]MDT8335033.1 NAD-dependent malic enzyme [Desulfurivibrionaceae bacterium]
MSHNSYGLLYDEFGGTAGILVYGRGTRVMANNFINKGTAFTERERFELGLSGSLPPAVRPLDQQVVDSARKVADKASDIEKFIYIRALFDRNVTLAHALIASDIEKYMRIIYTPTVGLACRNYSSMFRTANGLHFHPDNIDQAETILRRYIHRDIRVAVVTDNQGILGIGDQGAGGIAICLGKLMLYTQGAGIAPWHCLPISLDVGTDNRELLADDFYLGWQHERLTGTDYVDFVQRFARAFRKIFPNALCQWEDFSKQNAFAIRDAYLHDLISFNDDIQGTGAIALAGVLTAMRIKGARLEEQVFLVHGAGAGGGGIAEQILIGLKEKGLSEREARRRIFTLDRRGLVTTGRDLEPYKVGFAHDPGELSWFNDEADGELLNVIRKGGITVLIGTSGQAGCFTRQVAEAMLVNSERPVIMPLSNPTAQAEGTPADIHDWTTGRALVAAGSPFPPVRAGGKEVRVGQGNNVFVFPGVGLGVLAAGAREVLPDFFTAAAHAVAGSVSAGDLQKGILFPPVTELRQVSLKVARAVGRSAIGRGVSRPCVFCSFWHENDEARLARLVDRMRWRPEYPLLFSL